MAAACLGTSERAGRRGETECPESTSFFGTEARVLKKTST